MQAARGASLSSFSDHDPSPRTRVRLFAGVVVVAYALDQVTKAVAVAKLQGHDPIDVIPGLIRLSFLRNGGAALGTGSSMTVLLSIVAVVVCIAVVRISSRLRDRGWALGLGLLLAGALGNLTDRILREPAPFKGRVVDFIDYGPFVGNVADIALTFAAIVLIWRTAQGVTIDGTRERDAGDES